MKKKKKQNERRKDEKKETESKQASHHIYLNLLWTIINYYNSSCPKDRNHFPPFALEYSFVLFFEYLCV